MKPILTKLVAVDWLTDENWIILSFHKDFSEYLENLYFTPGTPKNEEFEVAVAHVKTDGLDGIAPFYRVKDNLENRESLRAAMAEFTKEHLQTPQELDRNIQELRQRIKETILPILAPSVEEDS